MTNDKLVDVPIDISEDTFLKLAMLAHEQDITINQLCNQLLLKYMHTESKKENANKK